MDRLNCVRAIRLEASDNVATLIGPASKGITIRVSSASGGGAVEIAAREDIRFGHKVALRDIAKGEDIVKYGTAIARARSDVAEGMHVHVHNACSLIGAGEGKSRADPSGSPIRHAADVSSAGNNAGGEVRIAADELRGTISQCLAKAGAGTNAANAMADHIIEAQLRGVETHGLRRLQPYLKRMQLGGVIADAEPALDADGALIRIDGRNGIGHHIATVAADAVVQAARNHGVAVALVQNSNHFGFAGYYATRIAAQDMLAMVTSNGQVCVGPDGALRPLFSNDPVAIAAPFGRDGMIEFDMATSVTSRAKIAQAAERNEEIAPGLALDAYGKETRDARAALEGVLLPFGGNKGLAFLFAIEMMTGVLTGGAYADLVASKEAAPATPEGTAHFMLAIDLARACGTQPFRDRLADMVSRLEQLAMSEGATPARPPGKRRWLLRAQRLELGIPLAAPEFAALAELAAKSGVALPRLMAEGGGHV